MQITIIDVGTPAQKTSSTGRLYQEIELMYKDDQGKLASRKIMSFTTNLYKTVQTLQKGAVVFVQRQKNEKTGYNDWVGISTEGTAPVAQQSTSSSTSAPTRVTGSNYETKEERAARQVMIVRQSSISSAIAAQSIGSKGPLTPDAVIAYAKQLEAYVLGTAIDNPTNFDEMEDDIPE